MGNQNHRFKSRNFNYSRNDLNNKTVFGGSRNDHSRKENKGASSNNKSAYNPNRAFFDRKINTGESFQKPQDASRFLDAVITYEDKVDLIYKLCTDNGYKMLRLAITGQKSDSIEFLKELVIPFLKILGSDELNSGLCLRSVSKLVKVIYEVPGFVGNLLEKYQNFDEYNFCSSMKGDKIDESRLDDPQRKEEEYVMGWFVLKCCTDIEKGKNIPRYCSCLS